METKGGVGIVQVPTEQNSHFPNPNKITLFEFAIYVIDHVVKIKVYE